MLVDDKLAKEKLARICFDAASRSTISDTQDRMTVTNIVGGDVRRHIADAIRNTDLTDCQQPQSRKLLTRPAQVGGTVFGVGVCEDMVVRRAERQYEYEHEGIAPAPDQGSVRNATDDVQHCCGLTGFNPMLGDTCPRCELNAAIRALPVLEDKENCDDWL